jgi:Uma2 family endonuclease
MTLSTIKWTVADYHRIIDAGLLDDRRVELLNGEIVEMSPEGEPHAHDSTEVRDYLMALLGDRVKVRDGKPITIQSSNSEPEPDIAIVQPLGREYRQHHPYPENIFWLIEFSDSSLTRDLESKSKIYAAANIAEYWVVNLRKLRLVVFRSPIDGTYSSMQTFESGTISPLAFPEIQVSIDLLLKP